MQAVRVLPGEAYVTARAEEIIVTVLGSCVAACIRNPASGFGPWPQAEALLGRLDAR